MSVSPPRHDVFSWRGQTVVDCDGEEIGTVKDIYLDPCTDQPEWALVMAAHRNVLMPLTGAKPAGDVIQTYYEHAVVDSAPPYHPSLRAPDTTDVALRRHYGLPPSELR